MPEVAPQGLAHIVDKAAYGLDRLAHIVDKAAYGLDRVSFGPGNNRRLQREFVPDGDVAAVRLHELAVLESDLGQL